MQNGSAVRAHDHPRKTEFALDFDRGRIPHDASPGLPARVVLTGRGYYFIPCRRETHPCLPVCHERLDKRGKIYTSVFAGTADISSECLHARVCPPLRYLLNACNSVVVRADQANARLRISRDRSVNHIPWSFISYPLAETELSR